MSGFDNAKIVKTNNKEVESIKTNNGTVIYQRPVIATVSGNSITLGYNNAQWLNTNGNVIIDWGDSTQSTVNNPTTNLIHTYNDGKQSHDITFIGVVTSLTYHCFDGCTGLTSIIIPNSVTSLGDACFYKCSGLTSVTIPGSVTSLGNACFRDCSGLTSVTIPGSVTSLVNFCFYNCSGLTSVTIPDSVTSLGKYCFYNCSGLTSITIPGSVTSLGDYCFRYCSGLTSVTIPGSVTSLGYYCFRDCTALVDYQLYWTGNNIITYDSSKMPNNTNTKIYVPKGQKTNYVNKGYPSDKVIERSS